MTHSKPAYTVTLTSEEHRAKAAEALRRAPIGYRVTFAEPKRSCDQNARLWALLRDVSEQVEYYGAHRSPETWKDIFTAAYRQSEMLPSLDGKGVVQIGLRTSKMSVQELSDLMALIEAYGAENGVQFNDQRVA